MDKVLKFIKVQFYKLVMGVLAFLATGFLYGTWQNTRVVPEVQKNLNEFMTDQAENNKTYNAMLFNLNQWKRKMEIIDSLKNSKH